MKPENVVMVPRSVTMFPWEMLLELAKNVGSLLAYIDSITKILGNLT